MQFLSSVLNRQIWKCGVFSCSYNFSFASTALIATLFSSFSSGFIHSKAPHIKPEVAYKRYPPILPKNTEVLDKLSRLFMTEKSTQGIAYFEDAEWKDLCVHPDELRPEFTLIMGQCFNWKEVHGGWLGVVGQRVLGIRQTPCSTEYTCLVGEEERLAEYLHSYFQLETPLVPLYASWSKKDARLKSIAECLPGVRVLRQEPLECAISFICSSNNNILRITQMLQKLRSNYGTELGTVVVKNTNADVEEALQMHSFPTVNQLGYATEEQLRDLGFGYRAKFIVETTRILKDQPNDWLESLRTQERLPAQESLMKLSGVGRKVADCIALFSADQISSVPVDTHVWRIACRDYDPTLRDCKSLTPTVYERVGDLFRDRFGPHAGWAHSLLFAAEIPNFKDQLPEAIKEEMEAFKQFEKEQKEIEKQLKKEKSLGNTTKKAFKEKVRGQKEQKAKKKKGSESIQKKAKSATKHKAAVAVNVKSKVDNNPTKGLVRQMNSSSSASIKDNNILLKNEHEGHLNMRVLKKRRSLPVQQKS